MSRNGPSTAFQSWMWHKHLWSELNVHSATLSLHIGAGEGFTQQRMLLDIPVLNS